MITHTCINACLHPYNIHLNIAFDVYVTPSSINVNDSHVIVTHPDVTTPFAKYDVMQIVVTKVMAINKTQTFQVLRKPIFDALLLPNYDPFMMSRASTGR